MTSWPSGLRRQTRNLLSSGGIGSNPVDVDLFSFPNFRFDRVQRPENVPPFSAMLLGINGTDLLSAPVSLLRSIAWNSRGFFLSVFRQFIFPKVHFKTIHQSSKIWPTWPQSGHCSCTRHKGKMSIVKTLWAQDFLNRTTKLLFCLSGAEKSDLAWLRMRVLTIGQSRWETTKNTRYPINSRTF